MSSEKYLLKNEKLPFYFIFFLRKISMKRLWERGQVALQFLSFLIGKYEIPWLCLVCA